MRLFDERSQALREVSLRPRMRVYVCGITPYDSAHAGHAFTYVQFDVLVRYLRHLGVEVDHVQNVTDLDDDILRVARERGVDYLELAASETEKFERSMRAIGVMPASRLPRASAFVPEIVEEVLVLVAAGHAYERAGTVYFRIATDPDYGSVSGLSREQMLPLAAERGGHPEDPAKDDPLDFVLWQRSVDDEPRWDSPWGQGRPGWHIECSTIVRRLLGQPVDVHGGGSDLVYPHHESERAQAEGLPGSEPFVRHWMHTGMVGLAGAKMSKSLGNLVFVDDLLTRHSPSSVRELLLRHHYRDDWEFRESDLTHASGDPAPQGLSANKARDAFYAALDDDLDTRRALGVLDNAPPDVIEEGRTLLGLV
ncbi:MAG TPA: cysteine--tRNA ligase [Actinobacteria bacterium]|nr:cysteine--tRNA ligase [Actinomycetota bacterium]